MTTTATTPRSRTLLPGLVERLAAVPGREDRLTHVEVLPARAGVRADWPEWAAAEVVEAFGRRGITSPWRHQAVAADAAHAGQHVVLATGTASGKSLAYQLPALSRVRAARGARGQRGATVLYVAPTKALAQDQLTSLTGLGLDVRVATHDGDSPRDQRDWTRDHAEYVLTNPDMLHRSLLPGHARWAAFFGSLSYVVVDECHHYRGVFGAHVSHVLRRLRRVCASYGAHPTFVLASATVAEPEVAAGRLTGLDVLAVTGDDSPRGQVSLALWEPPFTAHTGENGAPVRRAASSETADLLADLVLAQVRTLAFVRSRRGVEHVALTTAELLAEVDPSLPGRVAAYRGGYLPEERRAIEAALRRGDLLGLAATNALELGIDVAGLDAVLMAGFPGTRAALWQQLGRAGRDGQDALGVLIARDDPLDTYLVHHPEALLGQPVEATVFDPGNPYVLGPHLCAAAQEIPLTEADLPLFGPGAREVLDGLTEAGLLRRRPHGWFWTDRRRAADLADIRSAGGAPVQLVETGTGRVIGTVDASSTHSTAHAGAVYVHRGETWLVDSLDLDEHVAEIRRADPDYSTSAREVTEITVVGEREHRDWGGCRLSFGDVDVSHQVVSFLKRRQPSGEVVAEVPLDLPVRTLRTASVWWTVPGHVLAESGLAASDLPGSAHAAEHCSIGLLPLFATCDRWDIGGVSTALHPDTGMLTVFVYDGHPGGAGFAERGFRAARSWLSATREAIASCTCLEGCPSCIQSPKCGNQNNPLDKAGATALLDVLLEGAPPDLTEQ
ncbi:DEAD/DEAH box helicase [Nocardioides lianchengensis]|uniref:DEAD/DEAH box helicase domain-containing protein n=1 Tax=Nocardioides lianchengensis TaxID=1045774 RepID=A0A1G6PXD1_9ACTN|nr:DEAD/DEAH box helicase [Nocardioides lianchengensis]NYG11994.1 DEAD/DEAH box helicase domain-containing protein [Nocardioides lianchengensis]SDC84057.1 DEAD/DEAH box helicase domain-containing protein [Nocardioides lianchengensis]